MKSLQKLGHAIRGLFLMRLIRTFPTAILDDKRVAIVGPASSAYNTGKGDYIDNFDLVVRLNKAPFMIRDKKGTEDIGSRTDILCHSFFENENSGGGALDLALYDRLNIRYLVNPIPTYFGYRVIFNFYKKYLLSRTVYVLSRRQYKKLTRRFGSHRPTTGFCALYMLMTSGCRELYITGFTFFKTGYASGYRDNMKETTEVRKHIRENTIHDPDLEFDIFRELLQEQTTKNIHMDDELTAILAHNETVSPS